MYRQNICDRLFSIPYTTRSLITHYKNIRFEKPEMRAFRFFHSILVVDVLNFKAIVYHYPFSKAVLNCGLLTNMPIIFNFF